MNITPEFFTVISQNGASIEIPRNGYEMIIQGDYSALVHTYGAGIIIALILGFLFSRLIRHAVDEYYTRKEAEDYQQKIMAGLPGPYIGKVYKK